MNDFDFRRERDAPSACLDGSAEIDVLGVHEETFVEQANRVGVGPSDEETRAADPVWRMALTGESIDERGTAHPHLLSQLVERADHPSVGQLCSAGRVHQARSDDGDARIAIELREQAIDRARGNDRVAVQEKQIGSAARADADVGGAREAQIRAGLDHADVRILRRGLHAAVARLIVDNDDFVARRGRRRVQRLEATLEVDARVVADDDDGDVDHARSSTANVSRAARGQSYLASAAGAASSTRARARSSNNAASSASAVAGTSAFVGTYSAASSRLSRAGGVSNTTGGSPTASAS